jgi:hypothetical protein
MLWLDRQTLASVFRVPKTVLRIRIRWIYILQINATGDQREEILVCGASDFQFVNIISSLGYGSVKKVNELSPTSPKVTNPSGSIIPVLLGRQ